MKKFLKQEEKISDYLDEVREYVYKQKNYLTARMTKWVKLQKIIKWKEKRKLSFTEIGKKLKISRQKAHVLYHQKSRPFQCFIPPPPRPNAKFIMKRKQPWRPPKNYPSNTYYITTRLGER